MGGDSSESEKGKPALLEVVDSILQVDQLARLSEPTRPGGDDNGISESSRDEESELQVEPVKIRKHKKRSARTRSTCESRQKSLLASSTELDTDVSEQVPKEDREARKEKDKNKTRKSPASLVTTEVPSIGGRFEGAWGSWKRIGRSTISTASKKITKLASRITSQLFLKFPEPSPSSQPKSKTKPAAVITEPESETSVSPELPINVLPPKLKIQPPSIPDTKVVIPTPVAKVQPKLAPPAPKAPAPAAAQTHHSLSFLSLRRRRRDEHGLRTLKVQMGVHFILKNESIRRNPKLKGKARQERDAKKKMFSLKLLDKEPPEPQKAESIIEEEEPTATPEFDFERLLPSQYYANAISKYDANTAFEHLRPKSKTNYRSRDNLLSKHQNDFGNLHPVPEIKSRDYKLQTERLLTETKPGDPEFPYFRYKPQARRAHPIKDDLHEGLLFHGEHERLKNMSNLNDEEDEARKLESDGHFYPKTPFTAQFAHLLPISNRL